jgi:hypothetical protein
MKFPALPIGQAFTWQGEVYSKTGPISATHRESGQSRMIPRSATVAPLGESPVTAPAPLSVQIDQARAVAALEALHRRVLEIVSPLLTDLATRPQVEAALAAALEEQREALGRP